MSISLTHCQGISNTTLPTTQAFAFAEPGGGGILEHGPGGRKDRCHLQPLHAPITSNRGHVKESKVSRLNKDKQGIDLIDWESG